MAEKGARIAAMNYSTLKFECLEGVSTVTLNRPERGNSQNSELMLQLADLFTEIAHNDDIRVVMITGAGRHFCTGGDISWFRDAVERRERGEYGKETSYPYKLATAVGFAVRNIPQPTIAAINGAAIGGGATLALACDLRIAATEAWISFPFASTMGIVPEIGSTYSLTRLIGVSKACELIFTGRSVSGKEAKEMGLVNEVVPLCDLQRVTSELAKSIAAAAPTAIQLSKRALYQGLNSDVHSQLFWEEEGLRQTMQSGEHKEAIQAFFEKRKPIFKKRK